MRSLLKFPLLALLCVLSAEILLTPPAIAGREGVTIPESSGSGLDNTFGPNRPSGPPSPEIVSERIYTGILNALRTIEQRESVSSVDGQNLPISPEQIARIESSLLGRGSNIEARLAELEQQLATEMGVKVVDLSLLGNSSDDLKTAIDSTNMLIRGFNSEELAAAKDSPTFMALLRLLRSGKDALDDPDLDDLLEEGSADFGIVQMTRFVTPPAAVETPPASRPIQIQPQPPAQPTPPPAVQEPIRGLW